MNKQQLLAALESIGMRPGRGLGQNFLLDGNLLDAIVRLGKPQKGEIILEVGPGFGALTRRLLKTGAQVYAVEFDHRIAGYLRKNLPQENFHLTEADACRVNYQELLPPGEPFRAIANLPYSISTIFIARMLDLPDPPREMFFMLQREMGERLQTWIERATGERPDFLHGGVSVANRQKMVDRFQNDRAVRVMIISLKAGGTGLNLTAASAVVHYDLWWNPAVEAQATDRAYRIGQRRDVIVWRFVCAGTFEERINEMLAAKRDLADLTVATGETWIGDLPTRELESIFSLDRSTEA